MSGKVWCIIGAMWLGNTSVFASDLPVHQSYLSGGWSHNALVPLDKDRSVRLIHGSGAGEDLFTSVYSFCAYQQPNTEAVKVNIEVEGTSINWSIFGGQCTHLSFPSNRTVIATPLEGKPQVYFRFVRQAK